MAWSDSLLNYRFLPNFHTIFQTEPSPNISFLWMNSSFRFQFRVLLMFPVFKVCKTQFQFPLQDKRNLGEVPTPISGWAFFVDFPLDLAGSSGCSLGAGLVRSSKMLPTLATRSLHLYLWHLLRFLLCSGMILGWLNRPPLYYLHPRPSTRWTRSVLFYHALAAWLAAFNETTYIEHYASDVSRR